LLSSLRRLYVEVQGKVGKQVPADDPLGPEVGPTVFYRDEPIDISAIVPQAAAPEPAPAGDIPLQAPPQEPDDDGDDDDADAGDDEPDEVDDDASDA
jgi:hypothetical protein